MARQLRIEFQGAIYHILNRGDRREEIFRDELDRKTFLRTLGKACAKTGWQVHAYCLMSNHFHLVVETPRPNLSAGMKWLLGSYTMGFNRRHHLSGHLFAGRFKSLLIDETDPSYLRAVCDYVHLNPARANLIKANERLDGYAWSSYPSYLAAPSRREAWIRCDRLLGEHGVGDGMRRHRLEFARRTEARRLEPGASAEEMMIRHGWRYGVHEAILRRSTDKGKKETRLRYPQVGTALRDVRLLFGRVSLDSTDASEKPPYLESLLDPFAQFSALEAAFEVFDRLRLAFLKLDARQSLPLRASARLRTVNTHDARMPRAALYRD